MFKNLEKDARTLVQVRDAANGPLVLFFFLLFSYGSTHEVMCMQDNNTLIFSSKINEPLKSVVKQNVFSDNECDISILHNYVTFCS